MDLILKPIILCIITVIMIGIIRRFSPETAPFVSVLCAIMLIIYAIPYARIIYDNLINMSEKFSDISETVKLSIKIIVISLVCEFASGLCADNNEKFIADKINFAGKAVILAIISPTVLSFMEGIFNKLKLP